jgi:hypothetical protein
MKGEMVDADTTWLGNPAKAARRRSPQSAAA